jgi:hypothetical protein
MSDHLRFEARFAEGRPNGDNLRLMFEHETVADEQFADMRVAKFAAVGARFWRCRFANLTIDDASFGSGMEQSEYTDCIFERVRMTPNAGGFTKFTRCTFQDVDISRWQGDYLELIDCVFVGKIRTSLFWGSPPPGSRQRYESDVQWLRKRGQMVPLGYEAMALRETNEFRGNDFSRAELLDTAFRGGIDLDLQRLPMGASYVYLPDAAAALTIADDHLARDDGELASAAREFLDGVVRREIAAGQSQVLLNRKTFSPRKPRPDIDLAFEALRAATW